MPSVTAFKKILQQETALQEIVQLVGKDSLSEDQKLTLGLAEIVREDFLQQNGFSDWDYCCPLWKTKWMLRNFCHFYDLGMKVIANSRDSNRRITYTDIKVHCDDVYTRLTEMNKEIPIPQNKEPVCDKFQRLYDDITAAFQDLEMGA
ncbi:MAG: hypothetical protein MHM6MM_007714 [Cercozoa sp. M6MM]